MEKEEKIAICALNKIFGFEPRLGRALIDFCGNPTEVFDLDRESLRNLLGPRSAILDKINKEELIWAEEELEKTEDEGGEFIPYSLETYPELLLECDDPPLGLYLKSHDNAKRIFNSSSAIAIVGTRDITSYGKEWCSRFVEALGKCQNKPTIISGLAFGVDACAHNKALECGLPTIAVMATGIDSIYPNRHSILAKQIEENPNSGIISDYPLGTSPLAIHFMRRNRIIAGLSQSIILVESRVKGGGMITAHLAVSYNRDLYALPGRIDDTRSLGCNKLIREKFAEAASDPEELVERLGLGKVEKPKRISIQTRIEESFAGSDKETTKVLCEVATLIKNKRGIHISEIAQLLNLSYSKATILTESLEAEDIISIDLIGNCSLA